MIRILIVCLVLLGVVTATDALPPSPCEAFQDVLCCCTTFSGGTCCAQTTFCGAFVPGCLCKP